MIVSGSQSLGKQDAERLKQSFPNTRIVLYYGSSELNYITYVTDDEMNDARNLIGKPFPNVDVTLQNGELFVQTPYHVEGISLPCSIHDMGEQDASGNFYFTGRNDDMLQLRGRKISALKIENAIGQLDGVLETAVVVKPRHNDMVLAAYVVSESTPPPSIAQLTGQLRAHLSSFEIPKEWYFVETLPKNESGKIDKKRLP
jgi:long-chain acyl-CoA synthetase